MVGGMARLRGVPILVHVHGGGFDQFVAQSSPVVRALARWLLESTPQVLSLSERWAERLRPLFPNARIDVLANPVEVARFDEVARQRFAAFDRGEDPALPPTALFLGDLLERKGIYDLIAAWPDVVQAVPGARLVLAGSGELERARAAAEAAGVSPLVEIPGWIGFPEKLRRLGEARLFVLPSYTEGVPISLLEAMAAGLPSVVTPVGGVLDAVTDGREALVIPPGDRAALARAIIQVLRAPELGRALAATARQRAAAFDVVVYADRLETIYRSILEGRSRELDGRVVHLPVAEPSPAEAWR